MIQICWQKPGMSIGERRSTKFEISGATFSFQNDNSVSCCESRKPVPRENCFSPVRHLISTAIGYAEHHAVASTYNLRINILDSQPISLGIQCFQRPIQEQGPLVSVGALGPCSILQYTSTAGIHTFWCGRRSGVHTYNNNDDGRVIQTDAAISAWRPKI